MNDEFLITLNEIFHVFLEDPFNNNYISHDIQICVLNKIIEIENKIKDNKEKIKDNKDLIKICNKEDKRTLSLNSKLLKDENIMYKEDIKKLREIIDSIVFVYFNKYDLKSLCWKQSPGFISGKDGLKKELDIFESYFKKGEFAILNDITNCLRYGDLTIMKNGKPFFIESKSSDFVDKRVIRQRENLKNTSNIIHNDTINNFLGTDEKFRRIHSSTPEINYIDILQDMIKDALRLGKCSKNIESGLTYLVLYKPQNCDFSSTENLFKSIKNPCVFYLNAFKHINENYTPFPLIIRDYSALQEFLNGNLLIIVILDLDTMNTKLNPLGYKLLNKDSLNSEYRISFSLNNEITTMNISNYNFSRIGREFLSLNWFISLIDDIIKKIRSGI